MEEPSVKYILLRARVGYTVEKNPLSLGLTTKSTPMQLKVLRGELLEGVPEAEQSTDSTRVAVVGIERKSLRLECPTEDVARLSEEETNLLLAITSSEGRYLSYIDRKRLAFGRQLSVGSTVFVDVKGTLKGLPGVVWYKGVLPPSLGTWFGVELIKHPGSGTCDGTFRNKRYFTCKPDCGIFVRLDKLTPREDEDDLKSSKVAKKDKMEEPSIKYILLCDRAGRSVERNMMSLSLMTKSTPMQVLRGELFEGVPEAEQPADLTKVAVVGIEHKSFHLECPTEDLARLSEEETNLLLAITSYEERYQIYIDRKHLAFGQQLSPGSTVFVEVKGSSKVLRGAVRYKGVLPPSLGTWFGVELIRHPGSGTCDGTFRNKQYFTCEPESGIFVGLDKLTPREDEGDLKSSKIAETDENIQAKPKSSVKDSILSFWKGKQNQRPSQEINGVLKIDERVVTFIEGSPARGTVRYIGEEVDSTGNVNMIVGLELDERLGSGAGERYGSQKFPCKRDYAAFVPWTTVIPEKDFDGNPGKAARQEALGKREQIHEDEMYTESMSCVDVPSGKQRQSRDIGGQPPSFQEKPGENNEEEKSLLVRLTDMEQQLTQLRAQLEDKESEKQEQGDRLQRRLREMEELLTNAQGQLQEKHDQLVTSEAQVKKMEEQLTNAQGQLQEKHDQFMNSEAQVREVTQQLTNVQEQLQGKDEEIAGLKNQVTELEMSLSTAQQLALNARQRQESPDWVILRDQIQVTDKCLGRGGWGHVVEGKYCGCAVAVKQIHDSILCSHNWSLFEREMNIASRCRHPCLLQFIGATNDEESPLFVTELMETSLRALLKRPLSATELFVISLDVARALNYLHQKQPSPIIHRDISSANVLLWRQGDQWRAKVSDYGTANFMQHTMTIAPGAPIYSAPEAFTKNQTVKVDVYSFGVLLCEMSIQEMPDPEKREQQVALVSSGVIRALIRRCLQTEPEERPRMVEIIDELEQPTLCKKTNEVNQN